MSRTIAVCLAVVAFCSLSVARAGVVDFERDVLPILKAKCAECHVGETAKNDYHVLQADSMLGYVEAGSSEDSSLWIDYLTAPPVAEDEESLVMPPDGPLPASELAVLKVWIDEGANWPEELADYESLADSIISKPTPEQLPAGAHPRRYLAAFGWTHPAVVHFPIAVLVVAAGAAGMSFVSYKEPLKRFALACLIVGAIASCVSALAGWSFAEIRGYGTASLTLPDSASETEQLIYWHRWIGVGSTAFAVLLAIAATVSMRRQWSGHLWRSGLLVCAVLIGIVGHQGGELVYGDIFEKAMKILSGGA